MARHAAPAGHRGGRTTAQRTHRTSEPGSHRAGRHRSPPSAPATSAPPRRPPSPPTPVLAEPVHVEPVRVDPVRVEPVHAAPARVEPAAAHRARSRVPAGVWEILAWAGFAVVVALVVVAASDNDVSGTALWVTGLGATVMVAVAVAALTRARE